MTAQPCIEGCHFGSVVSVDTLPPRDYVSGHHELCPNHPDNGERFDEHAADLDAWRADQARLKAAEDAAHARIDSALLRVSPFQVAHEERRAARADLEELVRCARAVGEAFDAPRTRLALAVNALLEAADAVEAGR